MIVFNTNFPGGNGRLLEYCDDGDRETITFIAEQKLGEPAPVWFYFEVKGLKKSRIKFVIANAHQFLIDDPSIKSFENNAPVYREENGSWERTRSCEVDIGADLMPRISFEVECNSTNLQIAFCYPYTKTDLEETLAGNDLFEQAIIGYSTKGRPIVRYRSQGPNKKKKGIFITGRQHAGEVGASWMLDGMIRWFLDPENAGWEDRLELWLIPFVDVDGVEEGCYGKDQQAGDMNRSWRNPFSPRSEISAVIQDLFRWQNHCDPFLYLDMHSPACEVLEVLMNIYDDSAEKKSLEWVLLDQINREVLPTGMELVKPNVVSVADYKGSSQGNKNTAHEFLETLHIPNVLFEVTYQGDLNGKKYSLSDYQCYGSCLAKALVELSCAK